MWFLGAARLAAAELSVDRYGDQKVLVLCSRVRIDKEGVRYCEFFHHARWYFREPVAVELAEANKNTGGHY